MNIDRVYETGIVFLFMAFSFQLAYAGEFIIYGGEEGTRTIKTPNSAQPPAGKAEAAVHKYDYQKQQEDASRMAKRQQEERDALERKRQQVEVEKIKAARERMAMEIRKQIRNNKPSPGDATNPGGVWIALPESN